MYFTEVDLFEQDFIPEVLALRAPFQHCSLFGLTAVQLSKRCTGNPKVDLGNVYTYRHIIKKDVSSVMVIYDITSDSVFLTQLLIWNLLQD